MSEDTQNPLLKALVVLVILLIVAVGIQAWYLLDIKARLNSENSQQTTLAMQKNQEAIAQAATGSPAARHDENSKDNGQTDNNTEKQAGSLPGNQPDKQKSDSPVVNKPVLNKLAAGNSDQQPGKRPDHRYAQNRPHYPPAPQHRPPGYQRRPPQWPPAQPYAPPRWPDPYTDDFFNSPYDAQTWDPYAEIQRMQREMDRLFNESFRRFDNSPEFQHLFREGMISPELDVREDDDKYTVQVNLPGSDESSVNVRLDGQQLTIEGKQDYEQQDRDAAGNIIFRERRSGAFKRSFTLPEPVDEKGMKTDINNGVLTIIIPKLKDPV